MSDFRAVQVERLIVLAGVKDLFLWPYYKTRFLETEVKVGHQDESQSSLLNIPSSEIK